MNYLPITQPLTIKSMLLYMETSNKVVLFVLTIVLDIIIIMALNVKKMKKFDVCYAFAVLIIHGIFIISLMLDTRALLDILHYSIFIFIALSPCFTVS